ncbi:aminotransferase class IV [Pseudonocardia spinosispora]|uniref:aminotransferase class IV n=1 Tax=Pseudonocardia spinosispora TaxID=103441 RepID=UPI0012EC4E81|nr:aminotransferase class IV [Pseudonocardia spinosispora]
MTPTTRDVAELNGVEVSQDQLKALALINYGHFTSFRVEENLRVRGLSLHLLRLATDCRRLFDTELDTDHIRYLVRRVVAGPAVVRVTVFDPSLDLGHPGADTRPQALVTTRTSAASAVAPLRLRSVRHVRDLPEVKHVGLFGTIWQRRQAQRAGFDDVLFIGSDGTVCEAATSNVGVVLGGRVVWPQAEWLPGVTMRLLIESGGGDFRGVTLEQLPEVEAVFATNAAVGVRPVSVVDGISWPVDHPRVSALAQRYAEIRPEPL